MIKPLGSGTTRTSAAWRPCVPMNTLLPLLVRIFNIKLIYHLLLLKHLTVASTEPKFGAEMLPFRFRVLLFHIIVNLFKSLSLSSMQHLNKCLSLLQISTRLLPTWWQAVSIRQSKSGSAAETTSRLSPCPASLPTPKAALYPQLTPALPPLSQH